MKTSARNQFSGAVTGLGEGSVNVEVRIRLDEHNELVATVTKESAELLDLRPGREVCALIKASSVFLATGDAARTTARNQLWGEVCRIHEGPVNAEVVLSLASGRYVTAVVTHDSLADLQLVPGKAACAVFQESAIILATWD